MDKTAFAKQVKDALLHLYDHVYLQERPLAELLARSAECTGRGRSLHRALLETIEALRPGSDAPISSAAWRPYRVLFLRYVEALVSKQISEQLAISPRQVRREHSRGVDMVIDLLWQRCHGPSEITAASGPDQGSLLDAAVARLSRAPADNATPVAETLNGAIAVVSRLAETRNVRFDAQVADRLPLCRMDRVVLRQIFLIVLTEILRCQPPSVVDVCVVESSTGLKVTFVGIADLAEIAAQVAVAGRLVVARHMLELQGGSLTIMEQEPPILTLHLPARSAVRVLVVDDDTDMVRLFQRYLGDGNFEVLTASSAEEALRLAAEQLPQAITLDVMMPDRDGWEVLQLLKNSPRTQDIPVVVCSVLRERELALSLGASEFVAKPVTQLAFLVALSRCGVPAEGGAHLSPPADSASTRPPTDRLGA